MKWQEALTAEQLEHMQYEARCHTPGEFWNMRLELNFGGSKDIRWSCPTCTAIEHAFAELPFWKKWQRQ